MPDPSAATVTALDLGHLRQVRWIWFMPANRLVRLESQIPDVAEYLRCWRGWQRRAARSREEARDG